jgi:CDP-glucose 4,6-dehydratase
VEGLVTREFWRGRRVLVTGHTGFKGAWLSLWLETLGAEVTGLALSPGTTPNLFTIARPQIHALTGDIRDEEAVSRAVAASDPEIVFHLAAQSLVRRSYRDPLETIAVNVTGTAVVLNALRTAKTLRAVVVATTDKVYRNLDDGRPFREDDPLGGHDPYSASKAAAELVTAAMADSFLVAPVATARAGNVIGGGDWSEDRIIPDIWRAAKSGVPLTLRHPDATRPWQHVLDPLSGYLLYAERLASGANVPRALNFGPPPNETLTVGKVADTMLASLGTEQRWQRADDPGPREMKMLALDPSRAIATLDWRPQLDARAALAWTADWYRRFDQGADARALCLDEIARFSDRIVA